MQCTAALVPDHQLLCDTRIRIAAYRIINRKRTRRGTLTKVPDGLGRVTCRCLCHETAINSFFNVDCLSDGRCRYHESHQARGHYRKIPEHCSVPARIGAKGFCSFDLTWQELRRKPGSSTRGGTAWVLGRVSSGGHRRRCAAHGETGGRSGPGMDAEAASVSNRIAHSVTAVAPGRAKD